MAITLRPVRPEDEPFLLRVYASTRLEELAPLGWSEADQGAFLRQQGEAQHHHYRTYYADADYSVIELEGQPVGRLYVSALAQRDSDRRHCPAARVSQRRHRHATDRGPAC